MLPVVQDFQVKDQRSGQRSKDLGPRKHFTPNWTRLFVTVPKQIIENIRAYVHIEPIVTLKFPKIMISSVLNN